MDLECARYGVMKHNMVSGLPEQVRGRLVRLPSKDNEELFFPCKQWWSETMSLLLNTFIQASPRIRHMTDPCQSAQGYSMISFSFTVNTFLPSCFPLVLNVRQMERGPIFYDLGIYFTTQIFSVRNIVTEV